ncbi:leucine-rich repeat flightless-interacting protein 2-like isoform X14 [Oncorhynchus masou masou]|uniref:leucine-rich repeat flightless-interacting protein 2-like isoform X14 n=1 Tax=Oncorhynchus masou masou TaxID=90313 RepID=UPI00318326C4
MGTQGTGRKRNPNKDRSTAEDDALNLISREAEARLAAKRAARAEAREIRMKELERQQKEIYQVQKKYYGLDNKSDKIDSEWGHIEQWMEDSERYSRPTQRHTSISDDDERMSVGSRGSVRDKKSKKKKKHKDRDSSRLGDESTSRVSRSSRLDLQPVEDRDYLEKGSRAASTLSAATLASLGGSSSRGESGETSITGDTETSIREIKDTLVEVEEKYRKAMVSNAQLDNEKNNLMYQVDTLKDSLMELEELLSESRREYEGKSKDFEREKHAHGVLQFQFKEMKETLKQSEELLTEIRQMRLKQDGFVREISDLQETVEWKDKKIGALERQKEYSDAIRNERDELRDEVVQLKDILKKHGIVLRPDLTANGETLELGTEGSASGDPASQLAQDSQTSPLEGGNSMLEIRLRKLVDERENLIGQVKKLKAQVEQKKQRNEIEEDSSPEGEVLENGTDPHIQDLQRDASRQLSDLKFKLVKSEQEVTALEQNVTRLEGQVTRYKGASENSEKVEDELKAEKRKLQRELRSALDKIDELESNNSHLSKRLDKMKANRSTATTP